MGESLRHICLDDGMPALSAIFRWLNEHQSFQDQYARAREEQAEALADEIVSIADEESYSTKFGGDESTVVVFDSTAVARNRLRVDARKWVASKLKPKKYGDRVDMNHGGQPNNPIRALLQQVNGTSILPVSDDSGDD
jgi:hypothetical protein